MHVITVRGIAATQESIRYECHRIASALVDVPRYRIDGTEMTIVSKQPPRTTTLDWRPGLIITSSEIDVATHVGLGKAMFRLTVNPIRRRQCVVTNLTDKADIEAYVRARIDGNGCNIVKMTVVGQPVPHKCVIRDGVEMYVNTAEVVGIVDITDIAAVEDLVLAGIGKVKYLGYGMLYIFD